MKITIENMGKEQDAYLKSIPKGQELWCTEKRLGIILQKLFPDQKIIHNRKWETEKERAFRPDYRIPELKLIIEFQGFRHFNEAKTICYDTGKRIIAEEVGYTFIEFPYFVQPTEVILKYLFGNLSTIEDFSNNYPHGFIHPDALLLGDFNRCGLLNALRILYKFPEEVRIQSFNSLEKRAEIDELAQEEVFLYNPFIGIDFTQESALDYVF